jgi:cation transport regulator ChaC
MNPHVAQNTSVIVSPLRNNKKISDAQAGLTHVSIRGKHAEMGQHDAVLANEVNRLHQMVVHNEYVKKTSLL